MQTVSTLLNHETRTTCVYRLCTKLKSLLCRKIGVLYMYFVLEKRENFNFF